MAEYFALLEVGFGVSVLFNVGVSYENAGVLDIELIEVWVDVSELMGFDEVPEAELEEEPS